MKQDIGFFFLQNRRCPDLVLENGDLKADNSLHTPSLISAFSDKRVEDENLPPGITEKRGWWGDSLADVDGDQIGSALWTLSREKITADTSPKVESFLLQAFNWMIDDGIAETIIVEAERTADFEVTGTVNIKKPDGSNIPLQFIWDGQELQLTAA